MNNFDGQTLSWTLADGCLELALHREPLNEIGSQTLEELERFAETLEALGREDAREEGAGAVIVHSTIPAGFCAGADLRELYHRSREAAEPVRRAGVRDFLERIHKVLNCLDTLPIPTIAAVHGVTFGGGFEFNGVVLVVGTGNFIDSGGNKNIYGGTFVSNVFWNSTPLIGHDKTDHTQSLWIVSENFNGPCTLQSRHRIIKQID